MSEKYEYKKPSKELLEKDVKYVINGCDPVRLEDMGKKDTIIYPQLFNHQTYGIANNIKPFVCLADEADQNGDNTTSQYYDKLAYLCRMFNRNVYEKYVYMELSRVISDALQLFIPILKTVLTNHNIEFSCDDLYEKFNKFISNVHQIFISTINVPELNISEQMARSYIETMANQDPDNVTTGMNIVGTILKPYVEVASQRTLSSLYTYTIGFVRDAMLKQAIYKDIKTTAKVNYQIETELSKFFVEAKQFIDFCYMNILRDCFFARTDMDDLNMYTDL